MGEVYLAARSHQGFERPVALKLLRREQGGPHAVERFHRECRVQARLDHPAIVPLIDVGVAPDGRPFLVLQYVDGVPVTAYADTHRLTIAERLRLVAACCRAVESAHARRSSIATSNPRTSWSAKGVRCGCSTSASPRCSAGTGSRS